MPDIFISQKPQDSPDEDLSLPEKSAHLKKIKKDLPFKKRKSYNRNPLISFSYMPANINFETRESEEKVVLMLRRHPVTNLGWIAVLMIFLFAPVVLKSFPILSFLPERFQFIAVLGWYMISLAYFLENFLNWFFNVNIITDERIVDIDFHNLIYKEVSDANLEKIQDVSYQMGGVIRTIFNYGNVLIQTASEVPNFEFTAVPKPDKVAKILQELRIEEEVEKIEGRVS